MSKTALVSSTPPLTPIPPLALNPESPSSIHKSNAEFIDKFASLFSPATPPATPTSSSPRLLPSNGRHSHHHSPPPLLSHRSEAPSSPSSDFGSFVSVSPAHDPLSPLSAPASPSTSFMLSSVAILKPHIQNASMRFFDQFTEEAKRASERNKKGYLDELLLHEDDPLYWLTEDSSHSTDDNINGSHHDNGSADASEGDKKEEPHELPISLHAEDADRPLVDLSFEDFSDGDASSSSENVGDDDDDDDDDNNDNERDPQPSVAQGLVRSPERIPSPSPSLPVRSLAAPSSSPPRPSSALSHTPPRRPESPSSSSTPPGPNYNTLSTFSSRWMSSLLSSSRISAPSTSPTTHQTLDTLFATHPSFTPPPMTRDHRHATHPIIPAALPSHSPMNTGMVPIPRTQHARNVSSSLASISHGTPFASHLSYFPPSGAPGFFGEDHSWDRGFSQDFDKGQAKKRSVVLKDRREGEGCVGVLDVELADLIRPHLPALSRLPHAWTLLYSLDQHGISLNTLYTRCEDQHSKAGGIGGMTRGALVAIKDSGDALFGAWIGEGIRLSKGAYYGGGDAFLWKYNDGQPELYKWTGKNDYVALCEPEFISFGGGDGQYGLYLDHTLSEGSSARCPTFENEPLCSSGPKMGGASTFECVGLEVWAVGM